MQGSKKHEVKSNNYKKQLHKVNKIHRHIANHGFGNGKATLDNGYGMFLSMLEYKLSDRKKYLVKVDKWFPSSQICHCCGKLHPEMKNLAIRTMKCECALIVSRDKNAAINILREGIRLLTEVV